MDKTIHWGILGGGNIANKFATDLQKVSGSVLRAVAARDPERAQKFAKKHTAKKIYSNVSGYPTDPK